MVKVPLSYSFLERRDARRKFSESLGAGASLAPRTRQRISLGSENDRKFRLRSCQNWKASSLSLEVVVPTSINKYRMRYVGLGRGNLRSDFVFRPRHAPEWLRARFLPVAFLANEEELTGKTFTTSLNTTNPITYVKFIFLRTSSLRKRQAYWWLKNEEPGKEMWRFDHSFWCSFFTKMRIFRACKNAKFALQHLIIFSDFASPWTTLKTEKRKFAFSWEMKSVSGHLKYGVNGKTVICLP